LLKFLALKSLTAYYKTKTRSLLFLRDIYGRRSLLRLANTDSNSFILSSVSNLQAPEFMEVDASQIGIVRFADFAVATNSSYSAR